MGTFFPGPCKYWGSTSLVFPLCMLMSLLGNFIHIYGSQTQIYIPDFSCVLQIADICLQNISILIPHKALNLNMTKMNSTSFLVLQPCSQSHMSHLTLWCDSQLCCSAQKPGVSLPLYPMSSLPPIHLPQHIPQGLQEWSRIKNEIQSFHTSLLSSLSSFHSISFLLNFQTFQGPLQHLRIKFKVLSVFWTLFLSRLFLSSF